MTPNQSIPKIALTVVLILTSGMTLLAQKFTIDYHFTSKDTPAAKSAIRLQSSFDNSEERLVYINTLPKNLISQGYAGASVDSVKVDSTAANVYLFLGKKYLWSINADSVSSGVLDILNTSKSQMEKKKFLYGELKSYEESTLDLFAKKGYPFASISSMGNTPDSNNHFTLNWKINKGVQYHIDSIRVYGKLKINPLFLQHYLGIFNGDVYNKSRLNEINRLLSALPFLEQQHPWDLMMLGTGATINLYLQSRRSSEINALIGFLPGNSITGKSKITADVRLNLKNALGSGENILVNWQQLQAQSPRLNLGLNLPYFLNTSYGIDFTFGMLKQDSTWLMLDGKLGVEYLWNTHKSFQIFYQIKNSYLLQGGIDTTNVLQTRKLPQYMDVRSGGGGITYRFENLDYKFNPRSGNELQASITAGIRRVSPSGEITQLKDPADPDFDFSSLYDTVNKKSYITTVLFQGSHFFPSGKRSALKLAINAGWIQSPQIFQNEAFRIGGYKLLRGFDEESIYADRYGVLTAEYRLLTGKNSYFFGFTDLGLTHASFSGETFSSSFTSAGIGIELETKVGLLNLSYAIGKRDDVKFDIRSASKIHFGYINYF